MRSTVVGFEFGRVLITLRRPRSVKPADPASEAP
jgi:hypothetical protein